MGKAKNMRKESGFIRAKMFHVLRTSGFSLDAIAKFAGGCTRQAIEAALTYYFPDEDYGRRERMCPVSKAEMANLMPKYPNKQALAGALGVSPPTIDKWLGDYGLAFKICLHVRKSRGCKQPPEREKFVEAYLNNRVVDCAKKFKCSVSMISKWAHYYGVRKNDTRRKTREYSITKAEVERALSEGNSRYAAEKLGMHPFTLERVMKREGIDRRQLVVEAV